MALNKNVFKVIDWTQIIKMIFWTILLVVLIIIVIWFTIERTKFNDYVIPGVASATNPFGGLTVREIKDLINSGQITTVPDPNHNGWTIVLAYKALYEASFHSSNYVLTNFSLMTFVSAAFPSPAIDPTTAWTTRSNAIDLTYSYTFITTAIAAIALALQIYIVVIMMHENHRIKKYNLSTKYPTSTMHLSLFKARLYTDFIMNLAVVFAFFNFLSTLIVVAYWIIPPLLIFIIEKSIRKPINFKDDTLENRNDLQYLIIVMVYQNVYTILKSIFLSKWGVNLDLIFSIILPIGTITVIVGLFIKNMLSSKVSNVFKAVRNIYSAISTFRIFYYTNKIDALNDFNFVSILPPMIKQPLMSNKISKIDAEKLMQQLDEAIKFVEKHLERNIKERLFTLYILLNNVTCVDQITELESNILKIEAVNPRLKK